jgi:hypothetical protein
LARGSGVTPNTIHRHYTNVSEVAIESVDLALMLEVSEPLIILQASRKALIIYHTVKDSGIVVSEVTINATVTFNHAVNSPGSVSVKSKVSHLSECLGTGNVLISDQDLTVPSIMTPDPMIIITNIPKVGAGNSEAAVIVCGGGNTMCENLLGFIGYFLLSNHRNHRQGCQARRSTNSLRLRCRY